MIAFRPQLISPWRDAVVSSLTNSISSNAATNSNTSHADSVGSSANTTTPNTPSHTANSHAATDPTASPSASASASSANTSATRPSANVSAPGANASSLDAVTLKHVASSGRATVAATAQDHHNALLVAHHLHALLAVVHQQFSTIAQLQHELRDHPKSLYRHDVQLEELRNLQDKFQEEKTGWLRQRDAQEAELNARIAEQRALQQRMHDEEKDIREQREQMFRMLEKQRADSVVGVAAAAVAGAELNAPNSATDGEAAGQQQQQQQSYQQQHGVDSLVGGGIERRSSTKERMSSRKCQRN